MCAQSHNCLNVVVWTLLAAHMPGMYLCSVCVCVYVCERCVQVVDMGLWCYWVMCVCTRSGGCFPGCMLDVHLGPHDQVCECAYVMAAGPRWVCLRAPHNCLAILGKHCLPVPPWSLVPHWTPVMCTCKLVSWGEEGVGWSGTGLRERRWELWA